MSAPYILLSYYLIHSQCTAWKLKYVIRNTIEINVMLLVISVILRNSGQLSVVVIEHVMTRTAGAEANTTSTGYSYINSPHSPT